MSATFRRAAVLSLAGALVSGTVSPAFAAREGEQTQKPAQPVNLAMASSVPVVPLEEAAVPSPVLSEAAQTRPIDMAIPRSDDSGFAAPALRRSLYVSFGALQILDAVSTRQALNAGAREANPTMSGIAGNTAALFAVKAGTAVATTFFAERVAKKHPRRAAVLMAVLNTAYVAVVAHNYRVARAR